MIYDNIKERCVKLKISISELERRAGLSNGTIGKWQTCMPYADNLLSVAKVLKCRMEDLMK